MALCLELAKLLLIINIRTGPKGAKQVRHGEQGYQTEPHERQKEHDLQYEADQG